MEHSIFRKGSRTFYLCSLLFPKSVRSNVFDLYSFVRTADDYVDQIPSDTKNFNQLKKLWEKSILDPKSPTDKSSDDTKNERVVKNIIRLVREGKAEKIWIDKFLNSMESDIDRKKYKTLKDSLVYVHGSAEMVGLIMARIMNLPDETGETAKLQGRALQWINFMRDIEEDNQLTRQYFPSDDLKKFGLKDLSKKTATENPKTFSKFIHFELERYKKWQNQAEAGYKYIPKQTRAPIQAAADMYKWTAKQIEENPMVIYEKKIKPSKVRILTTVIRRYTTDKDKNL